MPAPPAAAPGSGGPADGAAGPTVAVPVAPVVTAEDLRVLHELKTGRLIGASVGCVLAIAGVVLVINIRRRRLDAPPPELNDAERQRLHELLTPGPARP